MKWRESGQGKERFSAGAATKRIEVVVDRDGEAHLVAPGQGGGLRAISEAVVAFQESAGTTCVGHHLRCTAFQEDGGTTWGHHLLPSEKTPRKRWYHLRHHLLAFQENAGTTCWYHLLVTGLRDKSMDSRWHDQ